METEIEVDGHIVKIELYNRSNGLFVTGCQKYGIFVCRDTEEEALIALKQEMERQYGQGRIEL
jgi:hypothetical protein